MVSAKKWGITFLLLSFIFMVFFASLIIIIDPYYHYHKPFGCFEYDVDKDTASQDASAFIMQLLQAGMIRPTGPSW